MRDGTVLKIEATEENAKLPFDEGEQQAICGHVMQKETFFRQTYKRLDPSWFTDPDVAKIFTAFSEFYRQYDRVPASTDEFKAWQFFQGLDQADRVRIHNKISLCHAKTATYGVDYLASQITAWQKLMLCVRNLPQIANLVNSKKLGAAESLVHTTSKDLLFSSFQQDPVANWEDWRQIRKAEEIDATNAISTGLTILDRKLLPQGSKGSLLPGDTTVVIASANSGKSSCLSTIARHNVLSGKSVLWITREGRQHDMMTKMYCSVVKKTRQEFWQWTYTADGSSEMDRITKYLNSRLHYIHIPKVTAYVEDVVADVMRMQASRQAQFGKGYDLLIVDYPAIFQTKESQGAKWGLREIQDYLYRQFVQLAAQEKFHCLLVAQTNREGSRINKGIGSNRRLVSSEDVAECFGIIMSATNVLTINRDDKAQAKGYLTFYLVKSRSSEIGWAVTCRSNFAMSLTHSDELGATAYRGNVKLSDQIEDLLRCYNNRDVADGMIDGYKVNIAKDSDED